MPPSTLTLALRAARKAALAVEERDRLIRQAHAEGATLREIATCLSLSHTRVHQIVRQP